MTHQAVLEYLDREIVIEIDVDGTLRERSVSACTVDQMVEDIVSGEAEDAAHIISFNPTEGTSRDISEDVARQALALFASKATELTDWEGVPEFIRVQLDDEVEDAKAAWILEDVAETKAMRDAQSDYYSNILFPQMHSRGVRA